MSRIGNNPVAIPEGVTIDLADNSITVKGKFGELTQAYSAVSIKVEEGNVILERSSESDSLLYLTIASSVCWVK